MPVAHMSQSQINLFSPEFHHSITVVYSIIPSSSVEFRNS